jgi:membrane fusion protein (multidrug efflux system)
MNAREGTPAVAPAPGAAPTPAASPTPPAAQTPAAQPAPAAAEAQPQSAAAKPARKPRTRARKRALLGVTALVVLAGLAYGVYYFLFLSHYESTDNAYVQGNVVQITPQVGGTVVAIKADDTDFVKAGQLLVRLDPADAQVALDQAEAQLAQTVREVRTLFVNNGALQAQIASREADLARARSEVARAQEDVARREPLVRTGAVGKEEFSHVTAQLAVARSALAAAESGARAAREQLASNQALTQGIAVEEHPSVLRAAARVKEAYLGLSRTDLLAPVDGYVARRSVQLGQRVQAGAPLMSVVALNQVWVDANFKEGQLRRLRIGQPVTLEADVYGKKVEYHGTVEGLGAGTGSAFALLPAQNATGNWIKVVQRVPVRIALDQQEVAAHPLRVGLSMEARVDVERTDGRMLADGGGRNVAHETSVFDQVDGRADAEVRRIIAANMGRASGAAARPQPRPPRVEAAPVASAPLAAPRPSSSAAPAVPVIARAR